MSTQGEYPALAKALPVSEETVQRAISEHLALRGWLVRPFAQPRAHRELGGIVPPGWPDLWAGKEGRTLFIECKAPANGRVSAAQEQEHRALNLAGFTVVVARGVEDLEGLL